MKRIIIVSNREELLSGLLLFPSIETHQVSGDVFDDSVVDSSAIVLLSLDCCSIEEIEYCIELTREKKGIICGFAAGLTAEMRSILVHNGIAFFIDRSVLESIPDSIKVLFPEKSINGTAVFIDNDGPRVSLCRGIFSSFGYDTYCLAAPDELYSMKKDPAFILHNLSLKDIDLMSFVRKGSITNIFRTVPYIAFKSGGEGVSLNEINAGISRLTGYILSEEEVWSVVVFNLFRKELYSGIDVLSRSIRLNENAEIGKEPMRKIFFSKEANFFSAPNKNTARALLSTGNSLSKISESFSRMQYLEWLVCDQPGQTLISTGV